MCMVICVANQKGGVAKTTTVANLAVALNRQDRNMKILVVDLDSQQNCTSLFQKNKYEMEETIVRLFETKLFREKPRDIVHLTRFQNLHILPSHTSLSDKGYVVGNLIKPHERLKMFLEILNYDIVLIDTPPSLDVFSLNGLIAADYVLATTELEKFSITGLEALFGTISAIQDVMDGKPELLGTLPVKVDLRKKVHNYYMTRLPATTSLQFLQKYAIHVNAPLETAIMNHKTIFEYKATAKSKYQYRSLAKFVMRVMKNAEVKV